MNNYSSSHTRPLVSWLIPTTLYRHRWWKRLVEFLEDDFPTSLMECVILGTQDKDFARTARQIGQSIANALAVTDPAVLERWQRVRFIEHPTPTFNLSLSRNILLNAAQGDIVIHRDADTALIRYGFTRFAVTQLLRSRFGLLSFPSLQNGVHFKPGSDLVARSDPRYPGFLLSNTANGMTTVLLKSLEQSVGGRNEALPYWGEHTALCTKLARAGFLNGYTDDGYWLASNDDESDISLTDDNRNPKALQERRVTIAMLNDFYKVQPGDLFWKAQRQRYKVHDELRDEQIQALMKQRQQQFNAEQHLATAKTKYPFKPWECLSHEATGEYIDQATTRAATFFESVIERAKHVVPQVVEQST